MMPSGCDVKMTPGVVCWIVAAGLASRTIHTGFPIFDKYPGDALYAAMVYAILRLFIRTRPVALHAMAIMTAIELFQLTMIPAQMVQSPHAFTRICGRLLGAEFSFLDLLAYAIGIGIIRRFDSSRA
jgi:hypothetical protein